MQNIGQGESSEREEGAQSGIARGDAGRGNAAAGCRDAGCGSTAAEYRGAGCGDVDYAAAGSEDADRSGAVQVPDHPREGWRRAVPWALVVVWACFIFFMSAHTGSDLSQGDDFAARIKQWLDGIQASLFGEGVDVVSPIAHFCEYAVFGLLLQNAYRGHVGVRFAVVLAIVTASAYGVTDEIHQIFVPDRTCDPVDWLVDTAGASLGSAIAWGAAAARGNKSRNRSRRSAE